MENHENIWHTWERMVNTSKMRAIWILWMQVWNYDQLRVRHLVSWGNPHVQLLKNTFFALEHATGNFWPAMVLIKSVENDDTFYVTPASGEMLVPSLSSIYQKLSLVTPWPNQSLLGLQTSGFLQPSSAWTEPPSQLVTYESHCWWPLLLSWGCSQGIPQCPG